MYDPEKNQILNEFLRHISHIQDKEYQMRIWIKNQGPECQAFDDAVCDFFDMGDLVLGNYKSFGITEFQYGLLNKFRKNFRAFADKNDFPEKFIDSPEWEKIMELAKEVLKAFHFSKS